MTPIAVAVPDMIYTLEHFNAFSGTKYAEKEIRNG